MLGYYEDKKLIYAGRTGTGFTQANGRILRQRLEAMRQSKMPFVDVPSAAAKGALWVRPELVAEVQFSTWTADKLVRQASFKGLREDKKAAEVRREVPDPSLATTTGEREAAAKPRRSKDSAHSGSGDLRPPPQAWISGNSSG